MKLKEEKREERIKLLTKIENSLKIRLHLNHNHTVTRLLLTTV